MMKGRQIALLGAATVAVMYGMIYADVVMRAKESYQEGEKYWRWSEHPEERAQYLDEKFRTDKTVLDTRQIQGRISKEDYDRDLELLQFDHAQALKESTIKYAYLWYQTTVDLFSPPESQWVRMAREKLPQAKQRWEAELRAKKIPFENYMIQ